MVQLADHAESDWERVADCDFCHTTATIVLSAGKIDGEGPNVRILECQSCGLVRLNPRPSRQAALRSALAGGARARIAVQRRIDKGGAARNHARLVSLALSYHAGKPRSLYDFGCGAGTAMIEAAARGLAVAGHDVNRAAIDLLMERGLDARFCHSHELADDRRYDIVLLLDYLDRSTEPFADLQRARALLARSGIMVIRTTLLPDDELLEANGAEQFLTGGSIHFLGIDTLETMVERAGLELVETIVAQTITLIARAID